MPDSPDSPTRAPVLLEVERFERVHAGAERVLLRLDGRYGDRPGRRVLDARLFVDDGLAVHRHAPLEDDAPGAGDDAWLWRAAFEVPASYLTDARTRFALESEPGSLIDLPRPAELVSSSAVPLTARSARLARRDAAAISVVLCVAVAPGALPSQARTEVLRVHHADGTVVYVSADGQTLASIPPDAVVVDQPAPAPAPAPDPTPAPQTATAPDPAPTPAMSAAQQPDRAAAPTPAPEKNAAKGPHAPAKGDAATTKKGPARHAAQAPTPSAPAPATAGPTPAAIHKPKHHRAAPHHQAAAPVTPPKPPAAPADVAPLSTISGLTVASAPATADGLPALVAGNAAQDLQPVHEPAPAHYDLPGKGLQPLGELAGGPAHGPAAPVDTSGNAPSMDGVPQLFTPHPSPTPTPPPVTTSPPPAADHAHAQRHSGSRRPAPAPPRAPQPGTTGGQTAPSSSGGNSPSSVPGPVSGGAPGTGSAIPGGFFNSLPGPGNVTGVPNFVIQRFHVPPFLLSIYQAAGIQYGIRWEVLAAINEIETDYGRNLNVSSAGAVGWMQFMPQTWRRYGVDAT
ncbi:MAG: hypothetical protein QOE38_932, partial [Thermoleophilaceae bacterium]|nr:hypothetical protein [Thermoleophilaceae bacterium]